MADIALKDLIGAIVALIVLAVGLFQYRATAKSNFIKPVREAQLRLYEEASSAAARIATLKRETREWTESYQDFLRLFYGPLAILEDFDHARNEGTLTVEGAMIVFKAYLDNEKLFEEFDADAEGLSLALAHTCRESLGRSWGYNISQLEGKYQELALKCLDKLDRINKEGEAEPGRN